MNVKPKSIKLKPPFVYNITLFLHKAGRARVRHGNGETVEPWKLLIFIVEKWHKYYPFVFEFDPFKNVELRFVSQTDIQYSIHIYILKLLDI